MNKEEVIKLAREAGLPYIYQTGEVANLGLVERFAALVAAAEREECAKVCEDEICACCWEDDAQDAAEHLAAAIRNRGKQ